MAKYTAYDELDATDNRKPAKKRPRRASLLGLLAVLVGLVAIAVTQRDCIKTWADSKGIPGAENLYVVKVPNAGHDYWVDPYHVAAAGAGLAVFALLLRAMTGRTRGGWPVLALLLSGAAAGVWRYENTPKDPGTPERWVKDNVVDRVDRWIHPPPVVPTQPAEPGNETVVITPSTQPADAGPSDNTSAPAVKKPAKPSEPAPDSKPNKVFDGL